MSASQADKFPQLFVPAAVGHEGFEDLAARKHMPKVLQDTPGTAIVRLDRIQVFAAFCWIALSAAVLVLAAPLATFNRRGGPGPGFFLKWLASILLALAVLHGLALLRTAWSRQRPEPLAVAADTAPEASIRGVDAMRFVLMGGVLFAYAIFLPSLGFLVATTALCWATLMLLGRHPQRALFEALAAAFLVRFAFTAGLGVPLPQAQFEILRGLGL